MAKFHELLDSLGYGEDGITTAYPETFITDVTAAYDEDMSIPTSAVDVLKAENAELKDEIVRLKAHNYELITAVPAVDDEPNPDPEDSADDNENDSDKGVDSLFGDNDKDDN